MNLGSVRIEAQLVPFLREGVMGELSAVLEILAYQIDVVFDRDAFEDALARFDEARTLLEAIGVSEQAEPEAVELDLARWPRVLLAALESEYEAQIRRLQDRATEGLPTSSPQLPALEALTVDIRKRLGAPAAGAPDQPAQERGPLRHLRRTRGDD